MLACEKLKEQLGEVQVSICAHKDIRIYNLEERTERLIEEEKPITSLSVSKDGRYLLVNLVSEEIHLWDIVANSKLPLKYRGHRQGRYVIRSCFGGSDHAFIVSGSEDSQVCFVDPTLGCRFEIICSLKQRVSKS